MKKYFHISVIFLLILFLTVILGGPHNKKRSTYADSSQNRISIKAPESVQQHDILLTASLSENDFDAESTFIDLIFIFPAKSIFSSGTSLQSGTVANSASDFAHHYHLPRYLLFHNLKIRI
ncbi:MULTISPECIES: hypothetical protein [unclassified Chryseobacterium]|uniref:hypothetical protein n=1 Tax=unclassified Chryseobacterium TaxID=2593645 RepID=UPI0011CD7DB3|nr:hypothetical protein [Chryseobacterium sp. G0240]